jgi:splicing factor 3A subunit 3
MVKEALLTTTKVLEQARCLESEREANMLLASSLLRHHHHGSGEPEVDVSNLPGGVQDAWAVLSEASSQQKAQKSPALLLLKSEKEQTHLPVGQGQLGKVTQSTTLSGCLQRVTSIAQELSQRRPKDGASLKRAVHTAKSAAPPEVGAHIWLAVFDERLREIRSYHARHNASGIEANKRPRLGNPAADGYDLASNVAQQLQPLVREGNLFNAEEVMGKYVDLQIVYESSVIPIKHIFVDDNHEKSFGFADFLSILSKGNLDTLSISESRKLKDRKKYVRFLVALETYLELFLKRTQPLLKLQDITGPAITDFENDWKTTGGTTGWEAKVAEASMVLESSDTSSSDNAAAPGIDLAPYTSAADLEKAIDGDTLKAELSRSGLKCGGTVADRAKRLFLTKDTPLDQLPQKLFAKKKAADASATTTMTTATRNERRVDIARREVIVLALLNQLKPVLEATLKRTERRETQTLKEREKEMEEDLHGSAVEGPKESKDNEDDDSDEDDDDAPIYNPKGVPLGWDGKPIPYWLFKLHGLNHFYPCEICGNESYRGRRNFETHFAEAKHAYGMKSLGIPNTKHFHGVTKIEDAQKLWNKLKGQLQSQQFDGTKEEEYEDSHGNVLSRSTYEDLARQGLL